jgi:hypothetical protein
MAKKKANWFVVGAALVGVLIGLTYLGIATVSMSVLAFLGFVLGLGLIAVFPMLGYTKSPFAGKEWDWTVIVAAALLMGIYLIAPGVVYQKIDIYSSLQITNGLFGLVMLTTRAELM